MALVYATDLRFFNRDRPEDAADPELVVEVLSKWAQVGKPWVAGVFAGPRQGAIQITVIRGDDQRLEGWELHLSHPDAEEHDVNWTVTSSLTTQQGTHLAVRVDRSRDGVLRPIASTPRPPRFVSTLLADDRLIAIDDTFPISSRHVSITLQNVEHFASFLLSRQRYLPVIGYTPREEEVLDAPSFFLDNAGVAHVALLQQEASWELSRLLPNGHSVYGGAVRIWWPGLDQNSVKWAHPLWTSERSADRVYREVAESIRRVAVATSPRDPRFTAIQTLQRAKEVERLRADNSAYEELLNQSSAISESDPALLNALRRTADALEYAELAEISLRAAEERAKELEQRVRELEAEKENYRYQLLVRGVGAAGPAPGDVDGDFRAEIDGSVSALGQDANPREYVIGSQFLDSLESLGPSYRAKAVRTCCAVVASMPALLAKIEDHPLRTGNASSAPPRIRPSDGAQARRAYLEQRTPAARRLHYWVLPDGSVEFASVNLHDDMSIPE